MLEFVKCHLSTVLLIVATLGLVLLYFIERKWLLMLLWLVISALNFIRLALSYKSEKQLEIQDK